MQCYPPPPAYFTLMAQPTPAKFLSTQLYTRVFCFQVALRAAFFESCYSLNFSENILELVTICMADSYGKGLGGYMKEVVRSSHGNSYSRWWQRRGPSVYNF